MNPDLAAQLARYSLIFGGLTVCSVYLGLALAVYFHNRKSPANIFFSLFLVSFTIWLLQGLVISKFGVFLPVLSLTQIESGVLMAALFYFFSRYLVSDRAKLKKIEALLFVPGALVFIFNLARLFTPALLEEWGRTVSVVNENIVRRPDAAYYGYSLHQLVMFIGGFAVMGAGFFREKDVRQKRRVLAILIIIMVNFVILFISNNVMTMVRGPISAMVNFVFLTATVFLVSLNIMQNKAWTIEHLVDRIEASERKLMERNRVIESELDIARMIQAKLLPQERPSIPGVSYCASYLSMDKVGGDLYDYFYERDTMGVFIADVSGHGIPGAFIASMIKIALEFYWAEYRKPGELVTLLNIILSGRSVRSHFATAVYALVDLAGKKVRYCNAGHPPPLLYRRKEDRIIELGTCGTVLGIGMDAAYKEMQADIGPGDRLVFYTDGITEASNPDEEMFGDGRFTERIRSGSSKSPAEFSSGLLEELRAFRGERSQDDDITLVVLDVE